MGENTTCDVGSSHPGAGENTPSLPIGNDRVIKQAQNGEGLFIHITSCFGGPRWSTLGSMKANAVGKRCSVAERAYLAGLIDGDGAIMALIEPMHEKRFRFRVRIELKITQKNERDLVFLNKLLGCGSVRKNRTTCDWLTRDQQHILRILSLVRPYSRMKQRQIAFASKIIDTPIRERRDLLRVARLADALSKFNVRSKLRRKNYATMIQEHFSPND